MGRTLFPGLFFAAAALLLLCAVLPGCLGQQKSPSSVSASAVAGGISVSWSPASGVAGYNVYRSLREGEAGQKVNAALIVGETSTVDTHVSDGVAYYYTVKTVDAGGTEGAGSAQASATARVLPPRSLRITINGGANFSTQTRVSLSLSASGASTCRLSNDGASWSDWAPYSQAADWQLGSGEGRKTVYYACRDDIGNAAQPVTAEITLDTVPPAITLYSPAAGGQYVEAFNLSFSVSSPVSRTASCTGRLDGEVISIGVVDADAQVRHDITVHAASGARTLYMECNDGVLSSNESAAFTVTDKPYLSISIGDGSGYTTTASVAIAVSAQLATECRFSNDNSVWGPWQSYSPRMQWQLTSGDGAKTAYAQCRSASGVLSDVTRDSIILDSSPPPYISVSINNGASRTNSRDVTLGLYAFAASECRFANDYPSAWSAWEAYSTRRAWTLTPADGVKQVYFNCRKRGGEEVGTASASISLYNYPPVAPANLNVMIDDGAASTTSRNVDLTLHAEGALQCRLSADNYGWTAWRDYSVHDTYTLPPGDGLKTVYYQCQNDYGTKTTYSTIYLEANPPTNLQIQIEGGAAYTATRSVSLTLHADRASHCRLMESGSGWGGWEPYTTYKQFTLSGGDGKKIVYYECRNDQGTGQSQASIYLVTSPPPAIRDLTASVRAETVYLQWSRPEDPGMISGYNIYRSTQSLGVFTLIATSRSTTYSDTGVLQGETYSYNVKAADIAGNEAPNSNIAEATVGGLLGGE